MKKNIFLFTFLTIIFLCNSSISFAETGTIDTLSYLTKVCHDSTCSTSGVLNFRPTGATPVVIDDVAGISGHVWGNELGWITLNPTGQGLSLDASTGAISGKAWSQVSGWINFNPTNKGVFINPSTGEFSGWAWTGGVYGGWIKFDCTDASTCVKTTWRHNTTTGGGSSGGSIDVCQNIQGIQSVIPNGLTLLGYNCVAGEVDFCPNLNGQQSSVPDHFEIDVFGNCMPSAQVDYCLNLPGLQTALPQNYVGTSDSKCFLLKPEVPLDMCPNISEVQDVVPSGYMIANDGSCEIESVKSTTIKTSDMCFNIPEVQDVVPSGYMIANDGSCIIQPVDLCQNISGIQEEVPNNFFEQDGVCLVDTPKNKEIIKNGLEIVAYSFIPEKFQIPIDTKVSHSLISFLDTFVDTTVIKSNVDTTIVRSNFFKVDLTSLVLTGIVLFGILWYLILLLWNNTRGIVYSTLTRKPLKNIEIKVFNMNNELILKTETNDKGQYKFHLKKGEYRIDVMAPEEYEFPAKSLNFEPEHIYQNKTIFKHLYYGETIKVGAFSRPLFSIPVDTVM